MPSRSRSAARSSRSRSSYAPGTAASVVGVTAGLALDAASHWWADRRTTLAWLAKITGKAEFYRLGTDTVHTTTEADGITGKHIGTGAYALDLLCTNFRDAIA
ncbi:hypothetical protein AB0D12_34160 [Streptomyces sp. NPDC048479]|uniref:hypothetical protein n=1 Tax=Streptomyces sp. NPDC048479 TaxID=3154725 RepID=UPI0034306811